MERKLPGIIATLLLILLPSIRASSQDAILSQFFSVPIYVNPAFAGTRENLNIILNFRSHPLIDATNISAFNGSIDGFVEKMNAGVGLIATSNYQGNMVWTNNISAVYAYRLKIDNEWYMNLGAQAGYYRKDYRWANLDFIDPGQPAPEQLWKHAPDFATGILFYNDFLYGGLALHHLTQPNEGIVGDSKLPLKFTGHLGAFLQPRENRRANTLPFHYFISPNIIYQQQGPFQRFNYGVYAGFERIMAGVWYRYDLRHSDTLIFLLGLQIDKLRIGYSYDHSLSGFTDAFHGIHEISVSWTFQNNPRRLNCPVF